jgi:hypothetical protein
VKYEFTGLIICGWRELCYIYQEINLQNIVVSCFFGLQEKKPLMGIMSHEVEVTSLNLPFIGAKTHINRKKKKKKSLLIQLLGLKMQQVLLN